MATPASVTPPPKIAHVEGISPRTHQASNADPIGSINVARVTYVAERYRKAQFSDECPNSCGPRVIKNIHIHAWGSCGVGEETEINIHIINVTAAVP